jgi:hypothetical protein
MERDKRNVPTHIYLTKDEKAALSAHARKKGLPLATYLRLLALEDAGLLDDQNKQAK